MLVILTFVHTWKDDKRLTWATLKASHYKWNTISFLVIHSSNTEISRLVFPAFNIDLRMYKKHKLQIPKSFIEMTDLLSMNKSWMIKDCKWCVHIRKLHIVPRDRGKVIFLDLKGTKKDRNVVWKSRVCPVWLLCKYPLTSLEPIRSSHSKLQLDFVCAFLTGSSINSL